MSDDYTDILLEFSALQPTPQNLTIFEIGGFPHYENAISNVLKFYFNPESEHGLGTLLIDSFLAIMSKQNLDRPGNIKVYREFPTNGGRLDLLVETDLHIIGIENKINAPLKNDLDDYWGTLKQKAEDLKRYPIAVVLTPRTIPLLPEPWQNLTYMKLWDRVKSKLGHEVRNGDSKWLLYLFDLMNTTGNPNFILSPREEFFIKRNYAVEQMFKERNDLLTKLYRCLGEFYTTTKDLGLVPSSCTKQGIDRQDYLFFDFSVQGHTITLGLKISPKPNGWVLVINTHVGSEEFLEKFVVKGPGEVARKDNQLVISEWPINAPLEEIRSVLCKWLEWTHRESIVLRF